MPPIHHKEGEAIVFDRPVEQEQAARQRRENEQHEFARSQVNTNKWLARFTFALVIATFCTIGVGIWGASIYNAQLREMKHTNELTQQALNGNGTALIETLRKMQGQIDATTKLYGEAQKQTAQAQRLADESEISANGISRQAQSTEKSAIAAHDSVQVARDAMYFEQRPWVGVSVSSGPIGPISNSPNTAASRIIIRNSGRTPALHLREQCKEWAQRVFDDERIPDCEELREINKRQRIEDLLKMALKSTPGIDVEAFREDQRKWQIKSEEWQRTHSAPDEGQTLVPEGISDLGISFQLSSDLQWHYQVGSIVYHDPIKPSEEHITKYCLKQSSSTGPWLLCKFGQEMN